MGILGGHYSIAGSLRTVVSREAIGCDLGFLELIWPLLTVRCNKARVVLTGRQGGPVVWCGGDGALSWSVLGAVVKRSSLGMWR